MKIFLRTFMNYFSLYIGTDNSHTLWGSLYFLFLWKQLPVKKTQTKPKSCLWGNHTLSILYNVIFPLDCVFGAGTSVL